MSSGPDPMMLVVATFIACAIVLGGWALCAGLVALYVNRTVARLEAEQGPERGDPPDSALLLYALSVMFWPAGFILGAWLLRDARTARQGRTCVYIGLGYISVIVVLTCVAVAGISVFAPGWLG